jgi:hypothetical protein
MLNQINIQTNLRISGSPWTNSYKVAIKGSWKKYRTSLGAGKGAGKVTDTELLPKFCHKRDNILVRKVINEICVKLHRK